MNPQRGLGLPGALLIAGLLGGFYYLISIAPLFMDDFTLKQDARAVANEWLSRQVARPEILREHMLLRMQKAHIKPKDQKLAIETTDESVVIKVEYRRVWKLMFTDKAYARRFRWTIQQER